MHYQNFEMQLELFSNHCRKTNETGNENEASNQSANYVTRSNGGKKNAMYVVQSYICSKRRKTQVVVCL